METKIETSRLYEIKEARKLRQETALVFWKEHIPCVQERKEKQRKRKERKKQRKKKTRKKN